MLKAVTKFVASVASFGGLIAFVAGMVMKALTPPLPTAHPLMPYLYGIPVDQLSPWLLIGGGAVCMVGTIGLMAIGFLWNDDVLEDDLETGAGITTGVSLMNRK